MRKIIWLSVFVVSACAVKNSDVDLTGCWLEILPQNVSYIQGMSLKPDGMAESLGMATLKYHSWKKSDDLLILDGESIGNGQTIRFSDTLNIISLINDTLTVERKNNRVSFVRKSESELPMMSNPLNALRPAYEGFEWTKLSGAGLRLMVQESENIRLIGDPSLPGIVMVRTGDAAPHKKIQIFDLKNSDINELIPLLETIEGWDKEQTCKLKEIKSDHRGVHRYVIVPDGKYAKQMDEMMQKEPVPSTCSGWGVGNSGSRYFEVHENHPDKVLFVEIGQDAPLFDENSIEFADEESVGLSTDILYTLKGILRIGHEVYSFKPEESDEEFWIIDKTGKLIALYDKVTKGQKNGVPVNATLKVEYNGKWDEGFAADYDGVYFVREIIDLN